MKQISLMQQALGEQWEQLPRALKQHYQRSDNEDIGLLSIEYPRYMQLYLNFMRLFGALINRRGADNPSTVSKSMEGNTQYWHRTIRFDNGEIVHFKSFWEYTQGNELIEYVNRFLGLKMTVRMDGQKLIYEGKHFILKLGKLKLPIPEWLVLGHTLIEEYVLDDDQFGMDFRLTHPILGQIFRYFGEFRTQKK